MADPDSSDSQDQTTDRRPLAEDPNTSICAMQFEDGAAVGLTSAASPMRKKRDDPADASSDAHTIPPPALAASDEVSPVEVALERLPGVPEVALLEEVSSTSKIRDLSVSSSSAELPAFRRVEFEDGRPVHLDAVADPSRPRKSEAPGPSSSKPPPMAHADVSASELVNLNSVVIEDPHRLPSNRPAPAPAPRRATLGRQLVLGTLMFLLGVGTTLLILWLRQR